MKPLLCNTQVVQNILAGIQCQDRRPVKRLKLHEDYGEPDWDNAWVDGDKDDQYLHVPYKGINVGETTHRHYAPWQPGDILYVRETILQESSEMLMPGGSYVRVWGRKVEYVADGAIPRYLNPGDHCPKHMTKRPSIHMPKWAARIFLKVKRVWVERVQDIEWQDAMAEGLDIPSCCNGQDCGCLGLPIDDPVREFQALWNSIYPGTWEQNIWVWCMEFERTEKK